MSCVAPPPSTLQARPPSQAPWISIVLLTSSVWSAASVMSASTEMEEQGEVQLRALATANTARKASEEATE